IYIYISISWVDYTNKYGFGYQLSDGTIGVVFNDNSRGVISPRGTIYEYYADLKEQIPRRFRFDDSDDVDPYHTRRGYTTMDYLSLYIC
ncbi:hypothetical protein KIPB_016014, partial [Kipferlia bialata]